MFSPRTKGTSPELVAAVHRDGLRADQHAVPIQLRLVAGRQFAPHVHPVQQHAVERTVADEEPAPARAPHPVRQVGREHVAQPELGQAEPPHAPRVHPPEPNPGGGQRVLLVARHEQVRRHEREVARQPDVVLGALLAPGGGAQVHVHRRRREQSIGRRLVAEGDLRRRAAAQAEAPPLPL
jgi:hypothetical protein